MANVSIRGIDNIVEEMERIVDSDNLVSVMGKACAVVEAAAKEKAPRDTGALRRSITSKVEANENGAVGTIYTPLEYAP